MSVVKFDRLMPEAYRALDMGTPSFICAQARESLVEKSSAKRMSDVVKRMTSLLTIGCKA